MQADVDIEGHDRLDQLLADFKLADSDEILGLLIQAMSYAQKDEAIALDFMRQASRLHAPVQVKPTTSGEQISVGGLAPWQVAKVKSFIVERISTSIALDELAQTVRLSTSYFSTAFKVSFGLSPHSYIVKQRVELAKRKMHMTEAPLSEIALDCGLSDQAHLSRVFRRATGTTPSAWRRYAATIRTGLAVQDDFAPAAKIPRPQAG